MYECEEEYAGKSRSQKKRESSALQGLGEKLAALSPATRKRFSLSENLESALMEYRRLTNREAKRRQMQYIGRLMRELDDPEGVTKALEDMESGDKARNALFKRVEATRDALLAPEEADRTRALADALVQWPALDERQTVHLVNAALADKAKNRPPKHARELFRLVQAAAERG